VNLSKLRAAFLVLTRLQKPAHIRLGSGVNALMAEIPTEIAMVIANGDTERR
jgi:hypothetical protein